MTKEEKREIGKRKALEKLLLFENSQKEFFPLKI